MTRLSDRRAHHIGMDAVPALGVPAPYYRIAVTLRLEQRRNGFFISRLTRRKTGFVDPIVQSIVDARVDAFDLESKLLRIVIA
jgi:hypothetical protein